MSRTKILLKIFINIVFTVTEDNTFQRCCIGVVYYLKESLSKQTHQAHGFSISSISPILITIIDKGLTLLERELTEGTDICVWKKSRNEYLLSVNNELYSSLVISSAYKVTILKRLVSTESGRTSTRWKVFEAMEGKGHTGCWNQKHSPRSRRSWPVKKNRNVI